MLKSEGELIQLIEADDWMMDALKAVKTLNLPDWWVGAGFARSKIWDVQHGFPNRTPLPDIDVLYYDASNLNENVEKLWEEELKKLQPALPWSVENQSRMHVVNGGSPYRSTEEAVSKFPETATALAVKLGVNDAIQIMAPHGIEDVILLRVQPTPYFKENEQRLRLYKDRIRKKNWQAIWPKLTFQGQ